MSTTCSMGRLRSPILVRSLLAKASAYNYDDKDFGLTLAFERF